jgi:ribosomal subunit interface protein
MRNVHVHITPHDVNVSPAVRELIQEKISRLSRIAGDVLCAEVVVRARSGAAHMFSVQARLALPGRDVHGNATHANLYGAIGKLVARLARLSRKRKTRLTRAFRRHGKKHLKRPSDVRAFVFAS